jgi:hypothetical protein
MKEHVKKSGESNPNTLFEEISGVLNKEVAEYIRWIDDHQAKSRPFIDSVFKTLKGEILKHFVREAEVG